MERYAPNAEGPGGARRRVARDGPRRSRKAAAAGRAQRLRAAQARPPRRRDRSTSACRRSARSRSSSPTSTRSRSRSRWCRRSTTRWAASRPTIHGQVVAPEGAASRTRSSTACTRSASAPASRCTAPTASAPIRCSTCWCSASAAGEQMIKDIRGAAAAAPRPAEGRGRRDAARGSRGWTARPAASAWPTSRTTCARTMQAHCGVFRFPDDPGRGRATRCRRSRERVAAHLHRGQVARSSTPRASKRSSSTTWSRPRKATMVSAEARKESRGAQARSRLPRARRRELAEAHAVVQGGQPPRLQAGEPEAADGRDVPAEGPYLLRVSMTRT